MTARAHAEAAVCAEQGSATALQPLLVAGHQVLWQLWNLCAFAHTPMEQAALAFLPGTNNEDEYQELIKLLLGVGVFVGITTSLLAAGFPSIAPQLFTPDRRLWPIMKGMAPQVCKCCVCLAKTLQSPFMHVPAVAKDCWQA